MKRYIRASYDPSMPSWLRGQPVLKTLGEDYAMAQAKFSKEPQENSITIYLLDTVYEKKESWKWGKNYPTTSYTEIKDYAYCPDDPYASSNIAIAMGEKHISMGSIDRYRKAKEIFNDLIKDTVYMVAPLREEVRPEGYVDPRYTANNEGKWSYAGQQKVVPQKKSRKNAEPTWEVPTSYSFNKRDKSGYVVPNPDDLYRQAYAKFPEKLKGKLDQAIAVLDKYYDILESYKDQVFGIDIRSGKGFNNLGKQTNIYHFNEAIRIYGGLYSAIEACVDADGNVIPEKLSDVVKGTGWGSLKYMISEIDKHLAYLKDMT